MYENSCHTDTKLQKQPYENLFYGKIQIDGFPNLFQLPAMIHFHLTYLYMETTPELYLNQTLSETLEREIMNGLLLAHNINSS